MLEKVLQLQLSFALRSDRFVFLRLFIASELLVGVISVTCILCGAILWLVLAALQAVGEFGFMEFVDPSMPFVHGVFFARAFAVVLGGIAVPVLLCLFFVKYRVTRFFRDRK